MDVQLVTVLREYFKTQPVEKAWVFGSFAREEETADSDIDILVAFDRANHVIGLLEHVRMTLELEDKLGRKVDLVEQGILLPFAVKSAERDQKLVYERAS